MANNLIDIKKDDIDMFKDIVFNKNEIMGTDETFFYNEKMGNGSESSLNLEEDEKSVSSDKLDLCDKSMEEEMNKVTLNDINNYEKRDLNKIPLPIFDCIYCANEKVAFNHLIKEEFFFKYLYNAEKEDIYLIEYLIENNLTYIENDTNIKIKETLNKSINMNKLKNLVKIILNNTENISKYYNINESKRFLKQKRKRDKYDYDYNDKTQQFEFNFEEKKYGTEIGLFEDDSFDKNDSSEKINKITQNIIQNSNEDIQKLDKRTEENLCNKLNDIVFINDDNKLFDDDSIDLTRKINWKDIKFEEKPYNIWEINSIDDEKIELEEDS